MRKISNVLRLHASGLSKRRIAASLNIGRTAVGDYIERARRAGLGWPLPEDLSDADLERLLFPPPAVSRDRRPRRGRPGVKTLPYLSLQHCLGRTSATSAGGSFGGRTGTASHSGQGPRRPSQAGKG